MKSAKTVEEYIASYPLQIRTQLKELRSIIRAAAPKAVESISYGMPAYKMDGKPLVYFGGAVKHIGFYPTPSPIVAFSKELVAYSCSKGAVQFPFGKKFPVSLIKRMIAYRIKELKAQKEKS